MDISKFLKAITMKVYNLNKTTKLTLGLVFALALLGFAGTADMVEEVVYNMPDSTYQEIKSKLSEDGSQPSEYEIAHYYLDHYGNE